VAGVSSTTKLARAIPGLRLVNSIDVSADGQRLRLWAGSDNNPATYFLFNRSNNHLSTLHNARPALSDKSPTNVKPVSYAAAEGTQIPGCLTLPVGGDGKNLPAIGLTHGGLAARDEWSLDWPP
jgi:dipeptidyl aminopeptidase/acylaminoacyl peptidase